MILFEEKQRFGKQYCEVLPMLALGGVGLGLGALGSVFGGNSEKKKLAAQQQALQDARVRADDASQYVQSSNIRAQDNINKTLGDARGYTQALDSRNQKLLSPYSQFGNNQIKALQQHMGQTPETFMDPGYKFRMDQGSKAVMNNAAGAGMLGSGDTLRALTSFGQDMGSQEYGNAFNRYLQKGNLLQGNVGMGQQAASTVGQLGNQLAGISGNLAASQAGLQGNLTSDTNRNVAALASGQGSLGVNATNQMDPGASSRIWGNYLGGLGGMAMGAAGTAGAGGGSNIFSGMANMFNKPQTPSYDQNWLGAYGR